jgi:hypothetical protein
MQGCSRFAGRNPIHCFGCFAALNGPPHLPYKTKVMKMKLTFMIITLNMVILDSNAQLPSFFPSKTSATDLKIKKVDGEQLTEEITIPGDLHRFFLFGAASINTTADITTSLTGAQKFAARYVVVPISTAGDSNGFNFGLDGLISMNALSLKPTDVSKDSIDVVSLMFPETGNAGFIIGPQVSWWKKVEQAGLTHMLGSEISFSLRHDKVRDIPVIDGDGNFTGTETVSFSVLNWNIMPIKYIFFYQPEASFKSWFSIGGYFNFFNVPDEDVANFNRVFSEPIFTDPEKSSHIFAMGAKISGGVSGFEFFADLRGNVNTTNLSDDNAFKGFIFNAGFTTSLQVFSR